MLNPEQLSSVRMHLTDFASWLQKPNDELLRITQLGTQYSFAELVPQVEKVREIVGVLMADNFKWVRSPTLEKVFDYVQELAELLHRIKNYDLKQQGGERNSIVAEFQQKVWQLEEAAASTLDRIELRERLDRVDADSNRAVFETNVAESELALEELRLKLSEAEQLLLASKAQVGEAGVDDREEHFKTQADKHGRYAVAWLVVTVVVSLMTLTAAGLALYLAFEYQPRSTGQAIQLAVAKLLLLSVLVGIGVLVTRNYRSHLHNQVLNQHRSNALRTFRMFVEAAEAPDVRDTVLVLSAQSIFAPRETGYEHAKSSAPVAGQVLSADLLARVLGRHSVQHVDGV